MTTLIKRLMTLCMVALLLGVLPARAAEINNLYDFEVPVESQSPDDRNQAIRLALRQVLVKVTGNAGAPGMGAFSRMLANASQYVLKFTYRLDDSGESERRFIRVYFDPVSVNQMISEAALPVWGKSRPQLIGWVGLQQGSRRDLLITDTRPDISSSLYHYADSFGLPFMLPLMDLEDQSAVSASDLWGSFAAPLQQASSRYLADLVVVVKLNQSGNYWKSSWSLIDSNGTQDWQASGKSLDEVISGGMQKLAGRVAAAFAPAGGSSLERINIQIDNVNHFDQLARLELFLDGLENVQELQVRSLQSGRAVLMVSLRGGIQAFAQAVGLSGFIRQSEQMEPLILQNPAGSEPEPDPGAAGQMTDINTSYAEPNAVEMDKIELYFEMIR